MFSKGQVPREGMLEYMGQVSESRAHTWDGFLILKRFHLPLGFWAVLNTSGDYAGPELTMHFSLVSTHGNPPASNFSWGRIIGVSCVSNLKMIL